MLFLFIFICRVDSTPESGPSSTSGQYNIFGNLNNNPTTPGNSGNNNYAIIPATHHPPYKPAVPQRGIRKNLGTTNQNVALCNLIDNQNQKRIVNSDGSDSERNFPDLLDTRGYNENVVDTREHKENAFCTLPRKRGTRTTSSRYHR